MGATRSLVNRFIPTGVGNTVLGRTRTSQNKVHPHGCGEYPCRSSGNQPRNGSSPRVWGIRNYLPSLLHLRRFIPTGVGNTYIGRGRPRRTTVHPHGCGEYPNQSNQMRHFFYSSPRVWGIPPTRVVNTLVFRFIPTGVWNTGSRDRITTDCSVHPHGCGEYHDYLWFSLLWHGSSPRVWGIPLNSKALGLSVGFIPTGVGNTVSRPLVKRGLRVHPHGCGEYVGHRPGLDDYRGSSPRVWGILPLGNFDIPMSGFIPTGVGNTGHGKIRISIDKVHPHGCGEYTLRNRGKHENIGSSPRVWGILLEGMKNSQVVRFIPTGVGNTSAHSAPQTFM